MWLLPPHFVSKYVNDHCFSYFADVAPLAGGSVLLILGVIYVRRWLKTLTRDQASKVLSYRHISSLSEHLISSTIQFAPTSLMIQQTHVPPSLSALSTGSFDPRTRSAASSGSYSPYSPTSEEFHFPILSADGLLLPPAPASCRGSWIDASRAESMERPLPIPPPVSSPVVASVLQAPTPWRYEPANEEPPFPKRKVDAVIGLYRGVETKGDAFSQLLRTSREANPSPEVSRVDRREGMYLPQRSFSYDILPAGAEDLA